MTFAYRSYQNWSRKPPLPHFPVVKDMGPFLSQVNEMISLKMGVKFASIQCYGLENNTLINYNLHKCNGRSFFM